MGTPLPHHVDRLGTDGDPASGHAITAMPATAAAWASGELGADYVDLLADAAQKRPR